MTSPGKKIQTRNEVQENRKWDLSPLYPAPEAWEEDFRKLDSLLQKYLSFQGHLADSPETLRDALKAGDELDLLEERLYVYAHLKSDENTADSENSGRLDRISGKAAEIAGQTAWFEPELMAIPPERFEEFRNSPVLAFYKRTLDETERERPHTLSDKEERILGMSSEIFSAPHKIFGMLNDADLRFPSITDADGNKVEITHGNFIQYMESPSREVRRATFSACYDTYEMFRNTFSSILDGTVKSAVLSAELRHFPSALEAALFSDNIPLSVYSSLIDTVHGALPALHRYFALRAKTLGLDKLDMFDIHNPLLPRDDHFFSYEKAVELVKSSLSVMPEEYRAAVEQLFSSRWIDVEECRGKRSGAYSSGCYRKPPYILLNHSGTLDSVFTLAHELGHSMHSWFSDRAQDYHYASYRIFAAEVASTTNELLLHHFLLNRAEDDSVRAGLLNHLIDTIRGTVYRQTMFAEFERDIHAMAEQDLPLTADALSEHYFQLNSLYHGSAVHPDRRIRFEWARIPHFHYNFYVYKYATGFSAAVAFSREILAGKTDRVMTFLKAGDSKDVIDILKDAGVDFTTPQPVQAAMELFAETVTSLETLLEKTQTGKNGEG